MTIEFDARHQAPVIPWDDAAGFRPGSDRAHFVISPDRGHGQHLSLEALWVPGTNDTLLVIFHGALPRDKYTVPRFEWLGTLGEREDNLLFLADPALTLSDTLSIGWFTGTPQDDVTQRAAALIRRTAETRGLRKVLLLGGSAGGFAAMMASAQVPGSCALAFSPQVTIAKYYQRFVEDYRAAVLPEFTDMDTARAGLPGRLSALDVYRDTSTMTNQVHLVQNSGDGFHMERHLTPLAQQLDLPVESTVSPDGRFRISLEYYGDGHGMPYKDILAHYVDDELDDMESDMTSTGTHTTSTGIDTPASRTEELAQLGRAGATGRRGVVVARGLLPADIPYDVEEVVTGLSIVSTQGSSIAGSPTRRVALDGAPILGDTLVRTADDAIAQLAQVPDADLADRWSRTAKQTAALTVWQTGRDHVEVLPDPLGGALVFRHREDGLELVSSDYRLLIDVLRSTGRVPRKNLMFQVERALVGNGGLSHASYEDTERLPILHSLTVTRRRSDRVRYPLADEVLGGSGSYLDIVHRVRQDVLDSVRAIADAPADHRILHLTGGFDSRLVLGAALHSGLEDRFAFFCSGPVGTVDREIADGLSIAFDLERTNWAGFSTHTGPTQEAQTLRVANFAAGLTATGPAGTERENRVIAGGGGYGEIFRTFYSSTLDGRDPSIWSDGARLADLMLGAYNPAQPQLITPAARSALEDRLADTLSEVRTAAGFNDWTADLFYSEVRNRYHMGQSSHLWSRIGTRVNPLYSVWGLAAARLLPLNSRRTNVVGFDLMESFDGRLPRYPFDHDRFSPEYRRQRRQQRQIPFPATGTVRFNDWTNPDPGQPATRNRDRSRQQNSIERSRALGMNFWQVDQLDEAQQSLSALLERIDLSVVGEALDLDYVRHLAHDPLDAKRPIRHVHAVHALLLWYGLGA